ncbi:cation-translocating P-type ATPase [Alteraurantiacibacter aquimixticola]|uniref:Cation-transporting P-type ATPase n=1 Tax=Alteraurantiacibacter aquimixticola TaxID=2489173 RepID=A0A4T3F3I1_9SPHN|nr:cation-transporting P-type ATPase [Alteraurantiacibacter aquimixticola]TIX50720.1 cation-transporting P-type ATPase [Alteraurantiacibacter aquimixticola]
MTGVPAMVSPQPHSETVERLLASHEVRMEGGLEEAEVRRRAQQYGPNLIDAPRSMPALTILLHQLINPVVYLLTAAAIVAFVFGQVLEGSAVLFVLLVNTTIGFVAESKATRSMEALRLLGHRSVRVLREGRQRILPAEQLVPGDIVLVEAGDMVSADLRIIEASNLACDESTFTGESAPVEKSESQVPADARLADRSSMLFKGTAVTRGTATGLVVGIGRDTELGAISQLVREASPARSPLEKRLAKTAGQLVWLTLVLAGAIIVAGLVRDVDPFLMVTTGIALAVAAIPEGLPVVATLALAQGMWRMARKNALLRQLSAVETFGSVSLILTDKTGTLTENRMAVATVCLPTATLMPKDIVAGAANGADAPLLQGLLTIGGLCSSSDYDAQKDEGVGDPMEIALLRAAANAGVPRDQLLAEMPLELQHAFDTETRMMATVHRQADGFLYAVKGAPEAVFAHCTLVHFPDGDAPMDAEGREDWQQLVRRLADDGLRVIALARKSAATSTEEPYAELVLLGVVGLRDPARADVKEAIAACRSAGIEVAIVTGDHAVTALSIGRQVGLPVNQSGALEGHSLARMDFDGALLRSTTVFARVNPTEKLGLVRAFQDAGEIVAMTGDGVNDAPALRQADIGVAMGKRGTDVAREAAAMVLLDDSFSTIVAAIREGRIIFENIRRFATYLLACNLSEVMVIGLAVLLALPLPLLPLQILFLNLVTDVFPAFALATAKGDDTIMQRPPRPASEAMLGSPQWKRIILHGLALTGATFGAMAVAGGPLGLEGSTLVTVTFLTLAFSQLWHVFNLRHPDSAMLRNEITANRWIWASIALCSALLVLAVYVPQLAHLLGLVRPDMMMWTVALLASLAPLVVLQLASLVLRVARGRAAI